MTRIIALSGGVGGAKLALGLASLLPSRGLAPEDLMIVANTGDDFLHLGLHVSPDIDTLLYVLSDRDDTGRGWGRRDETWHFMSALREIGAEDWFQLGDRDLALHVERTRRLRAGESLSDVCAAFAARFGIASRLVPMSDDRVATSVETAEGWLDFQRWFVGLRCEPAVRAVRYDGVESAAINPAFRAALADPELEAILICPSNPLLSIGPILALPGLTEALRASAAPVVAVAPLIGGQAIKGPTAKMMAELGLPVTAAAVAGLYAPLLDGYLVDDIDSATTDPGAQCALASTDILMRTLADRQRVAAAALDLARTLSEART